MEEIIGKVISFCIGFGIVLLVSVIWSRFMHYLAKKRVLKAIKDLDIEEDLANCIVGCNARCDLAITNYFISHGWGTPFDSPFGHLALCCLIGELRAEGKVKQLVKGGKP